MWQRNGRDQTESALGKVVFSKAIKESTKNHWIFHFLNDTNGTLTFPAIVLRREVITSDGY